MKSEVRTFDQLKDLFRGGAKHKSMSPYALINYIKMYFPKDIVVVTDILNACSIYVFIFNDKDNSWFKKLYRKDKVYFYSEWFNSYGYVEDIPIWFNRYPRQIQNLTEKSFCLFTNDRFEFETIFENKLMKGRN